MARIIVDLAAELVDHPASLDEQTRVTVTVEPPTGRLRVDNLEGSPRSIHRFVADPAELGLGGDGNLTAEQSGLLLATACSLTNGRVLFAPLQHHALPALLERDPIPPRMVEVVETPPGRRTTWTRST